MWSIKAGAATSKGSPSAEMRWRRQSVGTNKLMPLIEGGLPHILKKSQRAGRNQSKTDPKVCISYIHCREKVDVDLEHRLHIWRTWRPAEAHATRTIAENPGSELIDCPHLGIWSAHMNLGYFRLAGFILVSQYAGSLLHLLIIRTDFMLQ